MSADREALRAERAGSRTAFVLSGGASLGALQVGMLHALFEQGLTPDLLVGTSVGAVNAAFIASRAPSTATADQLAEVWCGLRREDVFPFSPRTLIVGLTGRRDHLFPDRGLRRLLEQHVEFADISEASIPLHVVAFDVNEQAEVLLSEGLAVDVIAGAAAIPGVFPTVRVGTRLLVDGGVANNTPLSHAIALGAERVFVLPSRDPHSNAAGLPRGAIGAAIDGIGVLTDARLRFDLERYARDVELIVLPCPNKGRVVPTDFGHSSQLIKEARRATRAFLQAKRRASRRARSGRLERARPTARADRSPQRNRRVRGATATRPAKRSTAIAGHG
jgi:NTE family protein